MNDNHLKSVNTSPEDTEQRIREKRQRKVNAAVEKKNKVLERLKVEKVDIGFLKPNAYNPNRQTEDDFELLCRSIEEDGFTQPVLALRDGVIIDGEHRWRAAQKLGFTEIPVVFVDMTPEQMRIATLRHNRARGTEDVELTSSLLRDLEKLGALEYAKDELMLDDDDINFLLKDVSAPEQLASESFSNAWIPCEGVFDEKGNLEQEHIGALSEGKSKEGVPLVRSYTKEAAKAVVELDRKIDAANSIEEVDNVCRSYNIFHFAITLSGREAKIVSKVLGNDASENLLRLCKKRYEKMRLEGDKNE